MLKSQDQVSTLTSRVLAPVNFIVLVTMIMVAGLIILAQSIMAEQSDRMIRATVSGLMAEQKKSLASEVEALALADPSGLEPSSSFRAPADYALIMDAHGPTLKAWERGLATIADGLGLMGPALNQLINASLTGSQEDHTQTGLVVIRGQLAIVALTPLPRPKAAQGVATGPARVLVLAKIMQPEQLLALGKGSNITDLRFDNNRWLGSQPGIIPIQTGHGLAAGGIRWSNPIEGLAILRLLPMVLIILGLLAALIVQGLKAQGTAAEKLSGAEARARFIATHDPLTQLFNRTHFMDSLKASMARLRRSGGQMSILLIDLDLFKDVNDTLGHAVGDALLRGSAQRIRSSLEDCDLVARLGGDLFAIQIFGPRQSYKVRALCERLARAFADEFQIDGHAIRMTLSIGCAMAPDHSLDAEGLLKRAELALKKIKANGRNGYYLFDDLMNRTLNTRQRLERDLRGAIKTMDQFVLYYQPQLDLKTGQVVSLEALIRWLHPELGLVPPGDFIPIAEETGLIAALGDWVIDQACRDARRWPDLRVSVNVSPAQFREARLVNVVQTALEASGISAGQMELEITESVLYANPQRTRELLTGLQALGIDLAMDDFGTGYSNLAQLGSFRFKTLKLDRSFVSRIGQDPYADAICAAVLSLAQSMRLRTVAEGVETEEQARFLSQNHCTLGQGFLFSRPLPVERLERLLAKKAQFWPRLVAA
jgi:diguanylate cyclase (GGDEF)-like protein